MIFFDDDVIEEYMDSLRVDELRDLMLEIDSTLPISNLDNKSSLMSIFEKEHSTCEIDEYLLDEQCDDLINMQQIKDAKEQRAYEEDLKYRCSLPFWR